MSTSTPSDTRPATSRRPTDSTSRASAATTIVPATRRTPARSPCCTWSIARPVSQGRAAVATMATLARTRDQTMPARYGRRKPSSRRKVRMQPTRLDGRFPDSGAAVRNRAGRARVWHTRGRMSDPIALRNRFAMVKGAWDEHLRGVPFPQLAEGSAEEKIERLEIALVDKMRRRATPETAEQAADAMWTLVHARDDADPVMQRVTHHHGPPAPLAPRPI